jgi:DeoR/GlpR family transcriptional regulator of sugar metabolism
MLASQRRQRILEDINSYGVGVVTTLSEKYCVSEMTIRRDLKALEEAGYIVREYGGAVRLQERVAEIHVVAREKRHKLAAAHKVAIARYAAQELVADGDILIIEGGTTAAAMVPYLVDKEHLTIVTNGLATCSDLHRFMSASATIIAVGGILRPVSSTFVGPVAERFFHDFHVNKLFLSATGLTLEAGATDPNMLETQVKKAMISASSQVILLMDSSKCHVKSLMTVLPVHEIDILVIDQECPPDLLQKLQARGVDVRIAPALPVENARS